MGRVPGLAFGIGGLAGTIAVDLADWATGLRILSYQIVFAIEGALFLAAAAMAMVVLGHTGSAARQPLASTGDAGE